MHGVRLNTTGTIDLRAEHSKGEYSGGATMREGNHMLRQFHSLRESPLFMNESIENKRRQPDDAHSRNERPETESVIVRLHNVQVSYLVRGETVDVLSIPEWSLKQGRHVALVGPSGCGKTTFLHLLSGLLSPTHGSIEVCGNKLECMREFDLDRFRANHIGYIFQSFNLLQGYTALENVVLGITFSGRDFSKEHACSLLERVGLADRMDHLPSQLSIGEKQRVAVARSLANKPELILADEPTGSLDPANSNAVADLIREVSYEEQCTLVIVSHDRDVVSRFDRVIPFLEINRAYAKARAD